MPTQGAGAAGDLVQHAGTRAVGEHRGLAGAQLEDLLQQRHALAHGAGTGERAEVAVAAVEPAAMEAQLRKGFAGEADVGIALVVAEQDVVARLVCLDQVVLEQQRLAFGPGDGGLHAGDLRDHQGDPRLQRAALEVARHPLLEVARLADIEDAALGIEHPVDARAVRQRGEELAGVERRGDDGVRRRFIAHRRLPLRGGASRRRRSPRRTSRR